MIENYWSHYPADEAYQFLAQPRAARLYVFGVELQEAIQRFTQDVYQKGLYRVIKACPVRGMSGEFDYSNRYKTVLRSYILAGRIMFTFESIADANINVSLVGAFDEQQPGFGLSSCYADIFAAKRMLGEVCKAWPSDDVYREEVQEAAFKADPDSKLDVVAAWEAAQEQEGKPE